MTTSYAGWDKTKEYFFAAKNYKFNIANKAFLDSFALAKISKKVIAENDGVNVVFYKYEVGKLDENFIHQEQPKQKNLFLEADAKILLEYSWRQNKFLYVRYYDLNGKVVFEKRNW